jgi:hypothetical protein
MAGWFVHSVVPYRLPPFCRLGYGVDFLRVLHVEKHGLHFRETELTIGKYPGASLWRHERGPFQYRSEAQIGWVSATEVPDTVRTTLMSLANRRMQPATALRSWNEEGWYVRPPYSRFMRLAGGAQAKPPQELEELFHALEAKPLTEKQAATVRDICFGFCYDPITRANQW